MCRRNSLILGLLFTACAPLAASPAEPNFTIRLLSGSDLKADKAWVEGDRLVYERYGSTGSVPMVNVHALIDRELEEMVAECRAGLQDAQANIKAIEQTGKQLRERSASPEERSAIDRAQSALTQKQRERGIYGCGPGLEKLDRNKRMFDEAREKAKR